MLSGVTATYISPGEGEAIRAESKIIHQGRMTAVVQTSIYNKTGRLALEVLSTHARRAD
jgi:acyl-coenzyme A thioesterase PaaI-like protein